jgi:hypothetical protein
MECTPNAAELLVGMNGHTARWDMTISGRGEGTYIMCIISSQEHDTAGINAKIIQGVKLMTCPKFYPILNGIQVIHEVLYAVRSPYLLAHLNFLLAELALALLGLAAL